MLLKLTGRFSEAVEYAREAHPGTRKGNEVPYLAHLSGVASLVLGENGYVPFAVTEDMAIAALLHDTVEDSGGLPRLRDIETKFGKEVAEIVEGCSDSLAEDSNNKANWETRKQSYIDRLPSEPLGTLLVSLADKLYNARSILEDYRTEGASVWKRFQRGREQQLWYFEELLKVFEQRCAGWRMVEEFRRTVEELRRVTAKAAGG